MKPVRMKSSFAGQVSWPAGSIQELEDSEADNLVKHGYAEFLEAEAPVDEKRSTRVQKPKRR